MPTACFMVWRMEYNARADKHTMTTILTLMKTKDFQRGLEIN